MHLGQKFGHAYQTKKDGKGFILERPPGPALIDSIMETIHQRSLLKSQVVTKGPSQFKEPKKGRLGHEPNVQTKRRPTILQLHISL